MVRFFKFKFTTLIIVVILLLLLSTSNAICQEAKYKLDLASADYPWGDGGINIMMFAQAVKLLSAGNIDITLHPEGEWGGDESDYIRSIEAGELDLVSIAVSPLSQVKGGDPLTMFMVPFLFKSPVDEVLYVFESEKKYTPLAERIIEQVNKEANFVILMISPISRRDVFSSKEINSIEDLVGVKIRTMASDIQVDTFNFMGGMATPLPYSECYTALQLHTVDAMEGSPGNFVHKKWYEVAPYWFGTNHLNDCIVIIMSKKSWNSLPTSYQNILKTSAIGAGYTHAMWSLGMSEVVLGGQIETLAEKAVFLTEEEHVRLRELVLPELLNKYSEKIGMDFIEELSKKDKIISNWYEKNK